MVRNKVLYFSALTPQLNTLQPLLTNRDLLCNTKAGVFIELCGSCQLNFKVVDYHHCDGLRFHTFNISIYA